MASQEPGRWFDSTAHKNTAHSSNAQHYSTTSSLRSITDLRDQGTGGLNMPRSTVFSDDSGFYLGGSADNPRRRPQEDFQLYDDDEPDYFNDDASMFANHGSAYQGSNNTQTSQIPKYTSSSAGSHQNYALDGTAQSSNMVYQSTESGCPSLFGQYEQVYATDLNPLQRWQVEPHRYEMMAMRYPPPPKPSHSRYRDEDIRLTPEPPSPQPRSARNRNSRSGTSRHRR
jgi:hypothetical protein